MRNGITIWGLTELINSTNTCQANINDKWVPARPIGWSNWKTKLRAITLILTERADVVVWPGNQ